MARITIEDCMEKVPNRFHLVRMASIRAKQLKKGARPLLTSEDNKEIVMSLREIAAGLVKPGTAEPPAPRPVAPVVAAAPRPVPRPAAPPAPKAASSIDWDDELEEDHED
jgi:DNA-directed RNA polymerase subunit omega